MRRLIAAALACLAACAPEPAVRAGWRDPAVAISSNAQVDPQRFGGDWHVVAAYGPEAACGPLAERWQAGAGGYLISGTVCGPGGQSGFATKAVPAGPGRVARAERSGTEVLWILWVDADYRIAAIGTPSGAFGRILSRDPAPRDDLLHAAREILAFNGYDLSQLRMLR